MFNYSYSSVHLFVFWRGEDLAVLATRQQVPCLLYTFSSSTHVPLKSISVVTLPVKVALAHYPPFAPNLLFCFNAVNNLCAVYLYTSEQNVLAASSLEAADAAVIKSTLEAAKLLV